MPCVHATWYCYTVQAYNGRSPELLLEAHPLQQIALAAFRPPRVITLRMGAPPGIYESMYHKTAQACKAEKRMTSK